MVKVTHNIFLLSCVFLLTGCFGIGETDTAAVDDSGLLKHSGIGYEVRVPASWEVVDNSRITVPVHGKIELALRSLVNRR